MKIDVRVVVIPDDEKKSADGVVRTDVSMEQVKVDIVDALTLGSADDWDIGVVPADPKAKLSHYTPRDGDMIVLIRKFLSTGRSFELKS